MLQKTPEHVKRFFNTRQSSIPQAYLIAGVILWLVAGLFLPVVAKENRLEAKLVDAATGQPLAARVALTNPDGRFLEIDGKHEHVFYLSKRWCYVNGSFTASFPASGAIIEIRRGLETRPFTDRISCPLLSKRLEKTFKLRRWTDMHAKGFESGDIHAHVPLPEEAHREMLAEDLNDVALLSTEIAGCPTTKLFTGKIDWNSTPGCELYIGEEIFDWQMGHLTLLGLNQMVTGFPSMGGTFMMLSSAPHWDVLRAAKAAHEQHGVVGLSHFSNLPGAESPIGVALGLVDILEIMVFNDPTQLPSHWDPWKNSGMSQAEFPILRGIDLYYQYLNAGFRLPIAAGTDKGRDELPLGSNRTYAPVGGSGGFDKWLASVKAGTCFVTNGPILEFEVDGQTPGNSVEFQGVKQGKARVKASSILPFNTIEIIMNGDVIATKTISSQNSSGLPNTFTAKDGVYSMELETTVELSRSSWLAARVADHPNLRNYILPRNLSVFAHTNPIYFIKEGHKVREEASIAYLRKYVKGVMHWLSTKPEFTKEEDRQTTEKAAAEALKIYEGL